MCDYAAGGPLHVHARMHAHAVPLAKLLKNVKSTCLLGRDSNMHTGVALVVGHSSVRLKILFASAFVLVVRKAAGFPIARWVMRELAYTPRVSR